MGGCGKRVCAAHRFHPPYGNFQTVVCTECANDATEDIKKNRCIGFIVCGIFIAVMLLCTFLPIILISDYDY